ncbi:MAG: hypothetical protein PHV17_00005, partial [Candidatus Omnitrophica bacterium]|nr:hypothetical protein [Candidatus Omnitrophota bacterium]
FALAFLAASVNHYLPHYLLLSSGFTIVFISAFFFNRFKSLFFLAVKNYYLLIITCLVGLFLVLPAFYSYIESKNYVSPVRQAEGKTSGLVEDDGKILGSCNAPFWGYRILVEGLNNYRANIHHAFYFGIIPLLFSAIALIGYRNRYLWSFFLAMLIILLFGLGNDFWGFRFCSKYIPGFSMFRHTFELGHFVSLLLICLSGYGFKIIFSDRIDALRYRQLVVVSFLFLILIGFVSQKIHAIIFTIIAILLVVIIATVRRFPAQRNKKLILSFFYFAVFFFSFFDLFIIQKYDVWSALSLYQKYSQQVKFPEIEMVYPSRRNLYFSGPDPIYPPDFRPLIFREAIALDKKESFSIFRNSRYDDLIKYSPDIYKTRKTLGVESSLYYLSSKLAVLPRDTPKDVFIRQMYESNQRLEGKVFLYDNDFADSINIIPAESDRAFIGFRAINRSPNSVEFYINSLNEGILVRRENFHRGWQAFIDGKKTEIFRANHAFSAIHLPAGEHQVRFVFKSVYPVLISIHSFFVFAVTILFNIYLFKYNRIEVD